MLSLGVRRRERARFAFFCLLLALLAASLAVGSTATDALLLGVLGVKALPTAILLASLTAMAGSLGYAGLVGHMRHDRLLAAILLGLAGLVLGGWAALRALSPTVALPALVSLAALAVALLNNHFWVLAGDSFDSLAQKRVFPRLALGSSLGGFLGGVLASLASGAFSASSLLLLWAALLALAGGLTLAFGRRLAGWSSGEAGTGEPMRERLLGSVRFIRRSALARGLLTMLLGMVLCLALAQYCYSDLFAGHYRQPERLAAFLGLLVGLAYLVEIPFLAGLTPWLLQRAGVPLTSLLHPLLAVLAFLALGLDYSLLAAVFAWSVHRMFQNCLGSPARGLVYNAFPGRYRPRLRAFLEGVASYGARALAGGLLLLSQGWLPPAQLVWPGLGLAVFYLLGALRVRRAYLGALLEDITRGGLSADVALPPERLARMGQAALEAGDLSPLGQRVRELPTDLLLRALEHPSANVRVAAAGALGANRPGFVLQDPAPEVRQVALGGASEPERERLLTDPDPSVRAAAAASLPGPGRPVLEELLASHPAEALARLPDWCVLLAEPFLEEADPRLAALAVARLASTLTLRQLESLLAHPAPEVRRAAARALGERRDPLALQILAVALADETREVRLEAARALAGAGPSGARAAEPALLSPRLATAEAAVLACGEDALRGELRGLLGEARGELALLHSLDIPQSLRDEPAARLLVAAMRNRLHRARRLALAILERLEGPEAVGGVRRRLRVGGARERAEALEALSNLGERESMAVLVELLDEHPPEGQPAPAALEDLLALAGRSPDARIRQAASAVCAGSGVAACFKRLLDLQQLPLLSGLSLDQLEEMLAHGAPEHFAPGELIYPAGRPADRFYVLLEGTVRHGDSDQEPVSLLGEIAVLDAGARRQEARAVTRCELVSWPAARLFSWIREHPELALELFRSLTGELRAAEKRVPA